MLPVDIGGRTQLVGDAALRPLPASQEISDKLSGLTAGQRVVAEIQALLPNGTYRAIVAQRDVTLALPFAAKAGDSLELEVVESNGKTSLAVVSTGTGTGSVGTGSATEAVSTTLSRTGQLIADLFAGPRTKSEHGAALPLNGGQPLAGSAPTSAADLAPQLKQAIAQSGMFYESHQRGWVEGRIDKEALLLEPQGRLSRTASTDVSTAATANGSGTIERSSTASASSSQAMNQAMNQAQSTAASAGAAPETLPVVRQQLDSLATQQFNWQGQIWPGQEMRWQIAEEPARQNGRSGGGSADEAPEWRSHMRLSLPQLGEIDARIALRGDGVRLDIATGDETTQARLRDAMADLRSQFDNAGLTLAGFAVAAIDGKAGALDASAAEATDGGEKP